MPKILTIALAVLIFSGCNPWETTKRLYQNRGFPVHIDLQNKTDLDEDEKKLAKALLETDRRIEQLRRSMDRLTQPPGGDWMQHQLRTMPWLNGLQTLSPDGRPLAKFPKSPVKKVDLAAIHALLVDTASDSMRLAPQTTEFGPEVCLVKPFFDRTTSLGCLLAHFDLRSLLSEQTPAKDIIVFVPGELLWTGRNEELAHALIKQDWEALLQNDYQGEIRLQGQSVYWLVRFIGADPLIYAVQTE